MNETAQAERTGTRGITEIHRQSLETGDIIATRAYTKNSRGVQFFTHADVSHTILYTADYKGVQYAVDAMPGKGVTKDRLHNKLTHATYAVVFRHRTATAEQRGRACQWAVTQALLNKPYEMAGAPLTSKPAHLVSPGVVYQTDRLACLGRLV